MRRGFTLIELLVVISIIGLLSSIVLTSLESARLKARDSKRKSDIIQIARALKLYYDDFGNYTQPENMCDDTSYGGGTCSNPVYNGDWPVQSDLRDLVTQGYLPTLPVDPVNSNFYNYRYEPSNPGQCRTGNAGCGYTLCTRLEVDNSNFCQNDTELHL